MRIARRYTLLLLAVSATPWALLLSVGGIWLLAVGAEAWAGMAGACRTGGVASMAAGQLVFACLVADKCFPGADRRLVGWIEILTCAVLLISVMLLAGRIVAALMGVGM